MSRFIGRWKYTLVGAALLLAGPFVLGLLFMLGLDLIHGALIPSLRPVGYWRAVLWALVPWAIPAVVLVLTVIRGVRKPGRRTR
jgi:hypothetical protein